jgi:hypothetical protein
MVIANRGALDLKKDQNKLFFVRKKKKLLRRSNEGGKYLRSIIKAFLWLIHQSCDFFLLLLLLFTAIILFFLE